MSVQAFLTAMAVNLKRLAAALALYLAVPFERSTDLPPGGAEYDAAT